jgi:hypothetical protein
MTPETSRGQLKNVVRMFPTPDVRGFTNKGSLEMLATILDDQEEFKGMTYRAATKKKMKYWPTPRAAGLCGGTGNWEQLKEKCENIEEARKMGAGNGGQLNPQFTAWLMGYPLAWTDTRAEFVLSLSREPIS